MQGTNLRNADVRTHVITEFGKAAPAIAPAADLDKIDLIALAPEPRSLLEGLRHPGMTANVLARTAAPILVVPAAASGESSRLLEFPGADYRPARW